MLKSSLRTLLTVIILAFLSGIAGAQVIRGAHEDYTEAIFDKGKLLLVLHQDSLGRTISMMAYAYDGERPIEVTHYRNDKQWKRVSYGYESGKLISVTEYSPEGAVISRLDTLDAVGTRAKYHALPTAPNPIEEWQNALEGSRLCSEDQLLSPDPLDGDVFLFGADGAFLCKVLSGYENADLLFWQGKASPITATFADPNADPNAIGHGTSVKIVNPEYIQQALEICGAGDPSHHGLFKGSAYLYKNSRYGGLLDFAIREEYGVSPHVFYLTATKPIGHLAQNHFNFGNYLWGASAHETAVQLWLARLGAHINNFFLSPDSRGTWDSPDDQLSIKEGYNWRENNLSSTK